MGKKKTEKKKKNINKGSKTKNLRICVLQILLEDYLKSSFQPLSSITEAIWWELSF